jgi:hypothetical protein
MQFHKVGDNWKPVDTNERLKDALRTAGAGFLLFSVPVVIVAVIAVAVFAFLHVGNPFFAVIALAVRRWDLVIILPAIGVVLGLQLGWDRSGGKSFEEITIETLRSIDERLESIVSAINEKDTYPDEMREELSGISAGLKRLDEIEEQIRSIRD